MMTDTPLEKIVNFSILLPVFNGENFLEESIKSVINQTYDKWELIIIDDGSIDNSYQIAKKWVDNDHRIRILHHPSGSNRGVSASRNLGIKFASGEWVSFLDADDFWKEGKLDEEYKIISSHEDIVLIYSKAIVKDPNNLVYRNESVFGSGIEGKVTDPFKRLINGFLVSMSSISVKMEALKETRGFSEALHFAEDTLFIHQILEFGSIYLIDEPLSYYRLYETSTSTIINKRQKISARFTVYNLLIDTVKEKNRRIVSKALVHIGFKRILRSYVVYPENDLKLVFGYLKRILANRKVSKKDKVSAICLFGIEYVLFPVKFIYLKF